jgi:hypothetical protein
MLAGLLGAAALVIISMSGKKSKPTLDSYIEGETLAFTFLIGH